MRAEFLSTSRPGALRLLGFLTLVVGAMLAGVGATLTWATVGFPGDLAGAADVPVKGVDAWEGVFVLAAAVVALILAVVIRLVSSPATRSAIAGVIMACGAIAAGLAVLDLATARDRFGGADGLETIATRLAARTGQPVDAVRTLLEKNFGAALRVDVGPGIPVALVGGVMLVVAGALALAWARRREAGVAREATPGGAGRGAPA